MSFFVVMTLSLPSFPAETLLHYTLSAGKSTDSKSLDFFSLKTKKTAVFPYIFRKSYCFFYLFHLLLCSLRLIKLAVVKICVEAFLCKQLFMAALLDNVTILHNQDQICIPDGGKSVSDDKAGSAFHQVIHSFLDLYLGSGINGGGSLIQDQDLIVCKNGSCNCQELLLALGNSQVS